jgi:hypothetical protein
MKFPILPLILTFLAGCNSLQETRDNATQELTENLLEKATGLNIDASNLTDVQDQKTTLQLSFDGNIPNGEYFSSVTLTKDLMAIVVKQDEFAFLINLYRKDGSFESRPIEAKVTNTENNGVTANVSIQDFSSMSTDGLSGMFMSQNGQLRITELSKDKLIVEFEQVKLAPAGNTDESTWKTLSGSILVDYPLYTSLDGSVESLVK